MKKQPKRVKQWVNVFKAGVGPGKDTAREARDTARELLRYDRPAIRVAVPLVELRRGEVVVDVEALVQAFDDANAGYARKIDREALRAAIKKVGVR